MEFGPLLTSRQRSSQITKSFEHKNGVYISQKTLHPEVRLFKQQNEFRLIRMSVEIRKMESCLNRMKIEILSDNENEVLVREKIETR